MGAEEVSGGQINLGGSSKEDIFDQPEKVQGLIGYCPQYDPINTYFSVQETINYFCQLGNVKPDKRNAVVASTIRRFGLTEFKDTAAGSLSGGNKRKLSCAMAMIANPKTILIDEASAGVDPISRRILWKAIKHEGRNSATVITTHAMEEAEALSSRLAIMVGGTFKCLGTLDEIRREYGAGFDLELSLDLARIFANLYEDIPKDQLLVCDEDQIRRKLREWMVTAEKQGVELSFDFDKELYPDGVLGSFANDLKFEEPVNMLQLQKEVILNNVIGNVIIRLNQKVSKTTLVRLDGSHAYLRSEKTAQALSTGYVFGVIEELKGKFSISEYSATQANLEQIFNTFATETDLSGPSKFSKKSTLR